METYIHKDGGTSLNTMSSPQVQQPVPIDLIDKLKENFAVNATKVDYYKDNTGTNWIKGYVGKNKDGAEWRIWTSYKPPMDGSDAKYIATGLNENQAQDMFKSIIGKKHEDILKSLNITKSYPMPSEVKRTVLKETEVFENQEPELDSDLLITDMFENIDPKLVDLKEIQTWEKQVAESRELPDYFVLKAIKGEVKPLIRWAGRVGFEKAIKGLSNKPGISEPVLLANWLVEKAGPRVGKPYEQQAGRQPGKGAGHIVSEPSPEILGKMTNAERRLREHGYGPGGQKINPEWEKHLWTAVNLTNQHGADHPEARAARANFYRRGGKKEHLFKYGMRQDNMNMDAESDMEKSCHLEFEKSINKAVGLGKPYSQQVGRKTGKGAGHIVIPDVNGLDNAELSQLHDKLAEYVTALEKESVKRFKEGASAPVSSTPPAQAGAKTAPKASAPKMAAKAPKTATTAGKYPDWQDWAWKDESGIILSVDPSLWRMSPDKMAKAVEMRKQGKGPAGRPLSRHWEDAQWNAIRVTNEKGYDDPDAKMARHKFHTMAGRTRADGRTDYEYYVEMYGIKPRGAGKSIMKSFVDDSIVDELNERYGVPQQADSSFEEADARVGTFGAKQSGVKPEAKLGKLEAKSQPKIDTKCPTCGKGVKKCVEPNPMTAKPELATLKKDQVFEVKEPELATLDGTEIKRAPALANLKVEKGCPVSKKQARLFGAVAGGVKTKADMSKKEAEKLLEGKKVKGLPEKAKQKK